MPRPFEFEFSLIPLIAGGAIVVGLSWLAGLATLLMLQAWRVLDRPNERSSHKMPIPRGGGLGVLAVFLPGAAVVAWWNGSGMTWLALTMVALLAGVSFWDDRQSLPWWLRLWVQLMAAAGVAVGLGHGNSLGGIWLIGLFVVLLAGYANAFNFMDGVDGLVTTQTIVSCAGLAVIAIHAGISPRHPAVVSSLLLAGAAAGFLPHNFPRARMFLGDVGSVSLGFLLMLLTIWLARDGGKWLWLPLGSLHLGFILDTSLTMLRRASRGDILYLAHREHFYQRLIRAGWSHPRVTGVEAVLQIIVVAVSVWSTGRGWPAAVVAGVFGFGLWLGFFAWAEAVFRRSVRTDQPIQCGT